MDAASRERSQLSEHVVAGGGLQQESTTEPQGTVRAVYPEQRKKKMSRMQIVCYLRIYLHTDMTAFVLRLVLYEQQLIKTSTSKRQALETKTVRDRNSNNTAFR